MSGTLASPNDRAERGESGPAARPLTRVVGITADGRVADPAAVRDADVVIGAHRHLGLVSAAADQVRLPFPSPLRDGLDGLFRQYAGRSVVVLATGDPMVSGIADTLIAMLGSEQVTVSPAVSSVALARSAMAWPAGTHAVLRSHGADVSAVRRELAPGRRILLLSADEHTPEQTARLLVDAGYAQSRLTVLGDLGTAEQSVRTGRAQDWAATGTPVPRLNVVAIEGVGPHLGGWVAGLPDSAFEHDGGITKRDLRASALARLAPTPGEHLWDVGAGAGSVGIEWMRSHPTCTATAVEQSPERAERIDRNAASLGVPALAVVTGGAPQALTDLPAPDAIFVGGGTSQDGVLDTCLDALPPGGRLVVHAVTVETEQLVASLHARHGGELTRIQIETAAPLGSYTGWTPSRSVTQWVYVAP